MAAASVKDEDNEVSTETATESKAADVTPRLGGEDIENLPEASSQRKVAAPSLQRSSLASVSSESPSVPDSPLGFTFGSGPQMPTSAVPESPLGRTRDSESPLGFTFGQGTQMPTLPENSGSVGSSAGSNQGESPPKKGKGPSRALKGEIKVIKTLPQAAVVEAQPNKVANVTPRLGGDDNDSEHSLEFTFGATNNMAQDLPPQTTLDVIKDSNLENENRHQSRSSSRRGPIEEVAKHQADRSPGADLDSPVRARPSTAPSSSSSYSPTGSPLKSSHGIGAALPQPPTVPPPPAEVHQYQMSDAPAFMPCPRPASAPAAQQVAIPAPQNAFSPQAMDYYYDYSSKIAHDAHYNALMLPPPPPTVAPPGMVDVSMGNAASPATVPYGPYFLHGCTGSTPASTLPHPPTVVEAPLTEKSNMDTQIKFMVFRRLLKTVCESSVGKCAVGGFVVALFAGLATCIILFAGDMRSG